MRCTDLLTQLREATEAIGRKEETITNAEKGNCSKDVVD